MGTNHQEDVNPEHRVTYEHDGNTAHQHVIDRVKEIIENAGVMLMGVNIHVKLVGGTPRKVIVNPVPTIIQRQSFELASAMQAISDANIEVAYPADDKLAERLANELLTQDM